MPKVTHGLTPLDSVNTMSAWRLKPEVREAVLAASAAKSWQLAIDLLGDSGRCFVCCRPVNRPNDVEVFNIIGQTMGHIHGLCVDGVRDTDLQFSYSKNHIRKIVARWKKRKP